MRRVVTTLGCLAVLLTAAPLLALFPGTDVVVPAGARGAGVVGFWVTDVYVLNLGSQSATVTVDWLRRDYDNTTPRDSETFTVAAGETLVLDDIFLDTFGVSAGNGAFRVRSTQTVVVNSRIYNQQGSVTFGQGFEGVPLSAGVKAGSSTDVVGLAQNTSFRSNVVLFDASGSGSTVTLSLVDETGSAIGSSRTYTLQPYDTRLFGVTDLPGVTTFDYGTLHAEVTSGAVIVVAAKGDNDANTGDPTTLEAWTAAGGAESADGTYQFAIYDSQDYASGGNLVVSGEMVTEINGTYMNWDKLDASQETACPLVFLWGLTSSAGIDLDDFTQGVTFSQSFEDSGDMSWTVQFSVTGNMSLSGTVQATGSNFPSDSDPNLDQSGCNGSFPTLTLRGGKSN